MTDPKWQADITALSFDDTMAYHGAMLQCRRVIAGNDDDLTEVDEKLKYLKMVIIRWCVTDGENYLSQKM